MPKAKPMRGNAMLLNINPSKRTSSLRCWAAALLWLGPGIAAAATYPMPPDGGDLAGRVEYTSAQQEDTLIDIARRASIGQLEIDMANSKVDRWLPGEGTRVVIPHLYILPDAPRAGIVVNIPEMRLYYYPVQYETILHKKYGPAPKSKSRKGKAAAPKQVVVATSTEMGGPISKATEVITYPVSMGRMDWRTPLGKTRIAQKVKDPTWTPPASIKREHALKGDILPDVVPAGPSNPLGPYAMKLGVAGYLIHGTDQVDPGKPFGIGLRVTHGCMRMYNEDVTQLYPEVNVGTPVYLVNQPVKLGWQAGELYMEASWPLDEDAGVPQKWGDDVLDESDLDDEEIKAIRAKKKGMLTAYLSQVAAKLIDKENSKRPILVDKAAIRDAVENPTGIPVAIGKEAAPPPLEAMPGGYPAQESPGQSGSPPPAEARPASPYPEAGPEGYGSGQYHPAQPVPEPYGADPSAQPPVEQPYGSGAGEGSPEQYPSGQYGSDQYGQPPADAAEPMGRYAPRPYTATPEPEARPEDQQYAPSPSAPEPSSHPDPYAPEDGEEEGEDQTSFGGV
jgi:L,D-transpeptidase ErfK/SrfK